MISSAFQQLYCNPAVFASFSDFHPISFARVLPFQPQEPLVDDRQLLYAEEAHLAEQTDETRLRIVEAYGRCGLLPAEEVANLKSVIDFFGGDFFEFVVALHKQRQIEAESLGNTPLVVAMP